MAARFVFDLEVPCRGAGAPLAFPFAIFGGEAAEAVAITGTGGAWGCAPGLTLADVPPTECFEESRVDTLSGRWWCGRRGMFWYR